MSAIVNLSKEFIRYRSRGEKAPNYNDFIEFEIRFEYIHYMNSLL